MKEARMGMKDIRSDMVVAFEQGCIRARTKDLDVVHTLRTFYEMINFLSISIYISTYIAPLQGNYSEALPAQDRPKRKVGTFCTFYV